MKETQAIIVQEQLDDERQIVPRLLNKSGDKRGIRHGLMHRPEYTVWKSMWTRCTNPNSISFKYYGALGICVAKEWRRFDVFLRDMGSRPSSRRTLDRINGKAGYSKENCRWATRVEQNNNSRKNKIISIGETSLSLSNWCRKMNLKYATAKWRIYKAKWNEQVAILTPTQSKYEPRPIAYSNK